MKTFADFGIELPPGKTTGKIKIMCPRCHERRHDRNDRSLSIDIDRGLWCCHYCNWSGTTHVGERRHEGPQKTYVRPTPVPISALSRRLVQYFNSRGISESTLVKMRVGEGPHFVEGAMKNTVQFNYYLHDELINVKYRSGDKKFALISGAEKIPYNLDGIEGKQECIITEGEIDCLSFVEIGRADCISVPNGANRNLEWLDDFVEGWFDDKETIYIASDTDKKGTELRDELLRRFGAERCRILSYGEGCKDANECLVKYGKEGLEKQLREAREVKVEGVFTLSDYEPELDDIYRNGLKKGFASGLPALDALVTFETKRLCVITGIPGCFAGDTRITLADGTHTTIRDIHIGDEVLSFNEQTQKFETGRVTYKWDSGRKEVWCLTLSDGSEVKATPDHKFLTLEGWKRLRELTENDYLLAEEKNERDGCALTDDELRLAALWIANGNKATDVFIASTFSEPLADMIREICLRNNLTLSHNRGGEWIVGENRVPSGIHYIAGTAFYYRKKYGLPYQQSVERARATLDEKRRIGKSLIHPMEMLKRLGLWGIKTDNLLIPEEVFKADNRQLAIFLNILFACDGWGYKGQIGYSSKSRQLCADVSELLRRFGISSYVREKHTKYKGEIVVSWVVDISSRYDVELFVDRINMLGKEDKVPTHSETSFRDRMIPSQFSTVLRQSTHYYRKKFGFTINKRQRGKVCARMVGQCARLDGNTDLAAKMEAGQWKNVKGKALVGYEQTYDIEVSPQHNFITTCVSSNSGKSQAIDQLCVLFNLYYGFKVAFFSPENLPLEYHAVKLLEMLCGRRVQADCGIEGLPEDEYAQGKGYLRDNFFHILPDDGYTIDNILAKARYLVKKRGIRILVLDPYNRIESAQDGGRETETQYISKVLDRLTNFAQQNDVLVFLMAHPTKVRKDNGNGGIPTMYDINGSANFYNKADFGLVIHRDRENQNTLFRVEKVKFRHLGQPGDARFVFNTVNGRYMPIKEKEPLPMPHDDMRNLVAAKLAGTLEMPEGALPEMPWDALAHKGPVTERGPGENPEQPPPQPPQKTATDAEMPFQPPAPNDESPF